MSLITSVVPKDPRGQGIDDDDDDFDDDDDDIVVTAVVSYYIGVTAAERCWPLL